MICECEHEDHFESQRKHKFGADSPAGVTVKTPFGKFRVCQTCADTCYKMFPVTAGIQK